ncbi:MAG TPA: hypothetical protein DEP84_16600 [Chloroflexi bacterium]|nr:hypothetical protein [Chloroflexota bacterium]
MSVAKRLFALTLFVSLLVAGILVFAQSTGGPTSGLAAAHFAAPPGFDQSLVSSNAVTTPPPALVFFPVARQVAPPCETHTALMMLEASAPTRTVGDVVTVAARLMNHGCAPLGLPQYRLMIESDQPEPVFDPNEPAPVTHSLGIGPGGSDAAEFVLRAVGPGQATLTASVSYEVHLGYPGPAYWAASSAGPLAISVTP